MPAQHSPRIRLPERDPRPVSRPLKTGRTFYLVLRKQRLVQKVWDKAEYDPGEEAELKVTGQNLGDGPLELRIDRDEGTDGEEQWMECAVVQAEVSDDQTEATARWTPPQPPAGEPLQDGRLVQITCDPEEPEPGATLTATLETEGLEDCWIAWTIEREEPDGSWRAIGLWDGGHIHDGAATTTWTVPDAEPVEPAFDPGAVVACGFADEEPAAGTTAWLTARTEGMEGRWITFTLEREVEGGGWEPVGDATATVRAGGEARVGIAVPGDAPPEGQAVFRATAGEAADGALPLAIEAQGADGEWLQVELEREVAPGRWESAGAATAQVQGGAARAELPIAGAVEGPAAQATIARIEAPEEAGGALWLHLAGAGADGGVIEAALEREVAPGRWDHAGSATAVARGGSARASVAPPRPPGPSGAAHGPIARIEAPESPEGALGLHVEGAGEDGAALEATLEREVAPGRWEHAGSSSAVARCGSARATVAPPRTTGPSGAAHGPIAHIEAPESPAGALGLRVERAGDDGAAIEATLEREVAPGRWEHAGRSSATVAGGRARAAIPPRPPVAPPAPHGPLISIPRRLLAGAPASAHLRAPAHEGQSVQVTLERELAPGRWEPGAEASARVSGGEARVELPVPGLPAPAPVAARGPVRLAPAERGFVDLEVGPELEGADLEVELAPEAGGAAQRVRVRVQGGRARVRVPAAGEGAGRAG